MKSEVRKKIFKEYVFFGKIFCSYVAILRKVDADGDNSETWIYQKTWAKYSDLKKALVNSTCKANNRVSPYPIFISDNHESTVNS
jgi:hypothetical protein